MELLQEKLEAIIQANPGITFGGIRITARPIRGNKVGYAGGSVKGSPIVSGYIVLDTRFVEYAKDHENGLIDTITHELAHLVAETRNDTKKRIWHGAAWQATHKELGGSGSRYYTGAFKKQENADNRSIADLYKVLPTEPSTTWERGTFRQWLTRGYHVAKGQKGHLVMWQFQGEAYEGDNGEEQSGFGRASAFYFNNDQVEPNTVKGDA